MFSSSSAYIVPADFSSEWRDIQLQQRRSHTVLYTATRYGRRFMLKALTAESAELTDYKLQQEKEFQLGISLVHPNIAATYGLEKVDGVGLCIVQELIDGQTLGKWLHTKPSLKARQRVLEQLLDAVEYLHSRQLVHHDLKPDNIMITRYGANVKLIDFGLSDTDDSLSPVANDPRVDVAAIEKLLPELLPFVGSHSWIILQQYPTVSLLRHALQRRQRWISALPMVVAVVLFCIAVWFFVEAQRAEKEEQRAYAEMIKKVEYFMSIEREELTKIANRRESYSLSNIDEALAYQRDMQDYSAYRQSMWAVRDSFVNTYPDDTPLHDAAWQRWVQSEVNLDTEILQQLTSKVQ